MRLPSLLTARRSRVHSVGGPYGTRDATPKPERNCVPRLIKTAPLLFCARRPVWDAALILPRDLQSRPAGCCVAETMKVLKSEYLGIAFCFSSSLIICRTHYGCGVRLTAKQVSTLWPFQANPRPDLTDSRETVRRAAARLPKCTSPSGLRATDAPPARKRVAWEPQRFSTSR